MPNQQPDGQLQKTACTDDDDDDNDNDNNDNNNNERGRDSSVDIATRYGLDGPGIESQWGARFSAPVQTGPEAHPPSCTKGTGSIPGVKRTGRVVDHPTSSAEVKERVELCLYSPSGSSWSLLRGILTST